METQELDTSESNIRIKESTLKSWIQVSQEERLCPRVPV